MEKKKHRVRVQAKVEEDTLIKAKKKVAKEKPARTISSKINDLLYDYAHS